MSEPMSTTPEPLDLKAIRLELKRARQGHLSHWYPHIDRLMEDLCDALESSQADVERLSRERNELLLVGKGMGKSLVAANEQLASLRAECEELRMDRMMLAVWRQTYEPNTYGVLPKSVIDEANAEFNRFAMRNRNVECLDVYPRKP